MTTRTFNASETLTWFAEVYDDSSQAAHDITYTTTVQDAMDGRPLVQAQDTRTIEAGAGRQAQGFTTSLPLGDLNPGNYVLRVDASTAIGGHTVRRDVLFEVE